MGLRRSSNGEDIDTAVIALTRWKRSMSNLSLPCNHLFDLLSTDNWKMSWPWRTSSVRVRTFHKPSLASSTSSSTCDLARTPAWSPSSTCSESPRWTRFPVPSSTFLSCWCWTRSSSRRAQSERSQLPLRPSRRNSSTVNTHTHTQKSYGVGMGWQNEMDEVVVDWSFDDIVGQWPPSINQSFMAAVYVCIFMITMTCSFKRFINWLRWIAKFLKDKLFGQNVG